MKKANDLKLDKQKSEAVYNYKMKEAATKKPQPLYNVYDFDGNETGPMTMNKFIETFDVTAKYTLIPVKG